MFISCRLNVEKKGNTSKKKRSIFFKLPLLNLQIFSQNADSCAAAVFAFDMF